MAHQQDGRERVARCACGNLTVTARGEPSYVHLCSCTDCQRSSGSAFSYSAFFPESAVSIVGEKRTYRQRADSGRFIDSFFCPNCGTSVLFRAEGLPGTLGVPVGASPIQASLGRQSCSGPRGDTTGSSFPRASR